MNKPSPPNNPNIAANDVENPSEPLPSNKITPYATYFQQAQFLTSATNLLQCPPDLGYEIAFAGRSNAGKSSAINTLTRAGLARTSKTPGRTQMINFFKVAMHRRLVDLPGYGYAKVPLPLKEHWQKHLEQYLSHRATLKGLVLLMDIRHPLKPYDDLLLQWAFASKVPVRVLLTKADKFKMTAARQAGSALGKALNMKWPQGNLTWQLFSSPARLGLNEAYAWLSDTLCLHDLSAELQMQQESDTNME